ncbi:MAG: C1 family peptidase [Polyangiaceae bacterium]
MWTAPDCSSAATQPLSQSPFVSKRLRGADIALPAQVDLRAGGLDGPVKNQQMVGVCWAFAISTVMDNALLRNGRQDVVAPLHVVASNTWNDIWRKGRSESALTVEPSWPYDPVKGCKLNEAKSEIWCGEAYHVTPGSWRSDASLVAEVNRAQRTGVHRISRVETIQVRPADTNHIASALASRQAVFASFDYNRTAWSEFGSGGPVIPDYEKTDGAHAVVLVGYRTTEQGRQFLIHNSWGTEWRAGGYAWISEAMVQRHLRDAFTADVASTGAVPQVEPKPPPTAESSCPEGQARDTVFGWCAPKCANGAGATAMLCPPATGSPNASSPSAGASSCPTGQVRDWLGGQCANTCRNGLPPVAGICLP